MGAINEGKGWLNDTDEAYETDDERTAEDGYSTEPEEYMVEEDAKDKPETD
jgi:hypothetical protein